MASSMATISSSSISLSRPLQVNRNRVSGLSSISFSIRTRSVSSLRLRQGASRFRVSCSAKPETVTKVCDIVRKQLALPPDSAVTGESKFAALGADSLDTVEIVMGLEEEFGISVEEETAQAIATVQDAADLIEKLMDNKKVDDALEKGSWTSDHGIVLGGDPQYQLIVDCNALLVDIENEIVIIHNFIRDKYRLKFPELESHVHHPIDYARVVKKIGNETDLTHVDLEGLLPSATIMVLSVTASATSGKPLPEDILQKIIDACDRALTLDSAKKKVLDFVESRMGYIAPNLSAIVGSAVAAKLIGTAGGLTSLAKMPACNVQLLGAKKKNLAGFSTVTSRGHVGYIEQTEVLQTTPPALRMRSGRLLAGKSTLAARVDSTRGDPSGVPSGATGKRFREEITKKIEKWQEPPPAKQPKPLPVPDSEPKKKRGGRRLRKMKERYAITDMRKLANRMQFGVPEESSLGDGLGEGYGMLGQAGSGKLRVSVGQSKLAAKVAKKFKEKPYGISGATSGLTSSLAFTPVQGIELSNPQAHAHQLGSGTQSTYFSKRT